MKKSNRIYADRDTLLFSLKEVFPNIQMKLEWENEYLTLNISNDKAMLDLVLHDFHRDENAEVTSVMDIIDESFFMIMKIKDNKGSVETIVRPLLNFLNSHLIEVILIPLESMNDQNKELHKSIGEIFMRNFDVSHDGLVYISYQHSAGYI